MLRLHFLILVNVSLIGTGCGVVWMWGICSPISLPIRSPDKACETGAEEEEASGLTAGPISCGAWAHVDGSDMPPVDTGALATQSHQVTS